MKNSRFAVLMALGVAAGVVQYASAAPASGVTSKLLSASSGRALQATTVAESTQFPGLEPRSVLSGGTEVDTSFTQESFSLENGPTCLHNCGGNVPEPGSMLLVASALSYIGLKLRSNRAR